MNQSQSIVAWAMKSLIPPILILSLLFIPPAFADIDYLHTDLDDDGKQEVITVYQRFAIPEKTLQFAIEGMVTVYNSDKKHVGSFSMPGHMGRIEFVSLNKDGSKQIIAWSSGGVGYTNLAIYGYKDSRLYKIFENGGVSPIEVDLEADKPIIKVGRANWEQKGRSYATGVPLWQVYIWNGKEFIYDENLSTAPEINQGGTFPKVPGF